MAFTFGFYNSLNHDRQYDAKQMSQIFDGLITDGVYAAIGNRFVIRSSTMDNTVIVGSGRAWFNHSWNYNDADLPLEGPQSHILYPRWDAIVLDINGSNEYRLNDIVWITGTAASTPTKPTMIHTEDHNQYPLCYIYRRPNGITIEESDIINCIGTEECPYCTGLLTDTKNIAPAEINDTASKAYAVGEYMLWRDELYKVTTAISQDGDIIPYPTTSYNVKRTTITTELYEKLVFDTEPISDSQHPVTSDGIYKSLYFGTENSGKLVKVNDNGTLVVNEPTRSNSDSKNLYMYVAVKPDNETDFMYFPHPGFLFANDKGKILCHSDTSVGDVSLLIRNGDSFYTRSVISDFDNTANTRSIPTMQTLFSRVTASTTDLTSGSSSLETGKIWMVYE